MAENKWINAEADEFAAEAGETEADRALALQIYASRLIGSDPDLVLHGGGNTSVKVTRPDLFGTRRDVLHVKGSGHDLATITAAGMPGLWLDQVRALRGLDRLEDADMVNALRGAMLDASGPYPSIESLLHAFLPHRFVNHSHATAMIALADLPDARAVIREIFGDRMGVVPFFKPGFDLGRAAADVFDKNPEAEGLILLNHGHFAFADSAQGAYDRLISQNNAVEEWFAANRRPAPRATPAPARTATDVLPALRGAVGDVTAAHTGNRDAAMPVIDLRRGPEIAAFLSRPDLAALAGRGIATPDHVIRTKNLPLLLQPDADIAAAVQDYAARYRAYFEANAARYPEGKIPLNPAPNVAWIPGLGVAGIARDARAAAAAADLAEQNIRAMAMAEDAGGYRPVDEARLFDMEYWSLEQAKLGRATPPAFTGRVVLVTGGAGAIGL
ncbi:MAG TPA: bifunctional aldolase/short-chain dehydrogenase, partial [Aliiroseovarius sp.]|nr:bifunctional aldolase/short-chain dehydrogenase [Aliiroseovarius sp.]